MFGLSYVCTAKPAGFAVQTYGDAEKPIRIPIKFIDIKKFGNFGAPDGR
jgi:hypothetical protein